MQETELKFQVPATRREALRRALATTTAQTTRLHAVYVDTVDHRLAAAGLALRLRKEGRLWVQTVKGRGDGLMQRLEHEVPLPPRRGLPIIDLALHDHTPVGLALRAALAEAEEAAATLLPVYRTDIARLHRRVRHEHAVVEVSYDRGRILVGDGSKLRALAVDEIEFELKSGSPRALVSLAALWAARYGLWWDVRTKSERGFRMALGQTQVRATKAASAALPDAPAGQDHLAGVFGAMLQSTLAHALPNLAEIAGLAVGGEAAPVHLHQLRVALRRLRTVLALFAHWSSEPGTARALEAQWQIHFKRLGAARDADVLAATWMPQLAAAGAPLLQLAAGPPHEDVGAALRDPAVSVLLLHTLALAVPGQQRAAAAAPSATARPASGSPEVPALQAAARQILERAWIRAWADAKGYAQASVDHQHRARKRLKRLRYALELLQPLFPAKPTRKMLRALNSALKALGDHNDLHAAMGFFRAALAADPKAWFAVGWLTALQGPAQGSAVAALADLKQVRRVWSR